MTPWSRVGFTLDEYLTLPLGARVAICAAPYLGWHYDHKQPAVAYESGSVPPYLVGRGRGTDCSTMTTSVLMGLYPLAHWTPREYADLQSFADCFKLGVGESYHPRGDAPIAAVERVGVGHVTRQWMTGSWHLVQGWRSVHPPTGGGHAFLVFAEARRLEVLQATSAKDLGPEFTWRTEAELAATYPTLHIARLNDG